MGLVIQYVLTEMRTIARAPVIFISALLVLALAAWWAMDWRYNGIIANKDSEISNLKTVLDMLKIKWAENLVPAPPAPTGPVQTGDRKSCPPGYMIMDTFEISNAQVGIDVPSGAHVCFINGNIHDNKLYNVIVRAL